jgi:hypothetical protein
MDNSPSSEANIVAKNIKKVPTFYRIRVHCRVHKSLPLVTTQNSWIPLGPSYSEDPPISTYIRLNIPFLPDFLPKYFIDYSSVPCMLHVPPRPHWFDHHNFILVRCTNQEGQWTNIGLIGHAVLTVTRSVGVVTAAMFRCLWLHAYDLS